MNTPLTKAQRIRLENIGVEERDVWNGNYPIYRELRRLGFIEALRASGGFVRYRVTAAGLAALTASSTEGGKR